MSHPFSSIQRFGSRAGRLSHVFLKDRLTGAKRYRRIAGYFRSSIFELVEDEIEGIEGIDSIDRQAQLQAQTLYLDGKGVRHPGKGQARPRQAA